MESKTPKFQRYTDAARNLIYPIIPLFAVACVWAVGTANALEAKIRRQESYYNPVTIKALLAAHQHTIVVSSVPKD